MPPNYRLETIAEKRFGGRWARLSRLVAIDGLAVPLPPMAKTPANAPARNDLAAISGPPR